MCVIYHNWSATKQHPHPLNSKSVQCNFFLFDHVTFVQFKLCCCVQNVIKIGWFFAEIWRYNDFQNGGRPPSLNCFTTHKVSVAGCSCLSNFMSILYTYLKIIRIFGLTCLFRPPNGGFGGRWTPKCDYSSSRPPKGTSLRKSTSLKLSTKNPLRGLTCRRVDRKCDGHTHTDRHTQVNLYSVHA